MQNTINALNDANQELKKQVYLLKTPFAGFFEPDDEETYMVEQERNIDHGRDNQI